MSGMAVVMMVWSSCSMRKPAATTSGMRMRSRPVGAADDTADDTGHGSPVCRPMIARGLLQCNSSRVDALCLSFGRFNVCPAAM